MLRDSGSPGGARMPLFHSVCFGGRIVAALSGFDTARSWTFCHRLLFGSPFRPFGSIVTLHALVSLWMRGFCR